MDVILICEIIGGILFLALVLVIICSNFFSLWSIYQGHAEGAEDPLSSSRVYELRPAVAPLAWNTPMLTAPAPQGPRTTVGMDEILVIYIKIVIINKVTMPYIANIYFFIATFFKVGT